MSTSLDMIRRRPVPAAERLVLIASVGIRLHPLYFRRMNSVKHSANPPRKTKPKGRHPDKALSAAFVRTGPARQTLRRQWLVPLRAAYGNTELDSAARDPGPQARAGTRQRGAGFAGRGPRAGAGQPQARAPGRRPARRETRTQGVPNFAESAVRVMEQKRTGWRSPHHNREGILSLRRYEPEAAICDLKMPCHAEGIISKEAWG